MTTTKDRKRIASYGIVMAALGLVSAGVRAQVTVEPLAPLTMTAEKGPRHFERDHRGVFNGQRVAYRSLVDETIIKDKTNQPITSLFTIGYVATGVENAARRPIIFVYNGGPGGSSAPLHFSGMGPKRLKDINAHAFADTTNTLVDNPLCPLDAADLVFIDPTDTGYSRTYAATPYQQLYSVDGDSDSLTQLVVSWLREHGRTDSPIYLYGESYGTLRAVAMARDLLRSGAKVQVAGIMMGGEAITYGQGGRTFNPIRPALSLPMMASVAWHYGKIDNKTQTWQQAVDKAREFARSDYLRALMKRYNLDPAEKDRIIRKLPELIGIPESYFREHKTLVVEDFNAELLKDQGLVLDGNNGLETFSKATAPGEDHTRDFSKEFLALTNAMDGYAEQELGVKNLGPYYTVTPSIMRLFDQWNFITTGATSLDVTLGKVLKDSPRTRVFVLQGRYDTLTQMGVTEYTMDQTDIPRDRYTLAYFDGGHFLIPTLEAMGAIRSFVAVPHP